MATLSLSFVFLFFFFGLLSPRNPDYNFPVSMELLLLGSLHLALAFKVRSLKSCRVFITNREKRLFWFALGLLVVVVTPRALYSVGILGAVPNYCKAVGASFQIVECLMQSAIDSPYGLRTLFQTYCALYITVLALFLYRKPQPSAEHTSDIKGEVKPLGLIVLGWWAAGFVVLSFWIQSFGFNAVLPEWLTFTPFVNRLSSIVANPGWVWPYLAVGFAATLALSQKKGRSKALYIALGCAIFAGIFLTQQRGGLLLALSCTTALMVLPAARRFVSGRHLPKKVAFATFVGVLMVASLVGLLLSEPQLIVKFGNLVGYGFQPTNLESGRFGMWAAAFKIFASAPLWGHGYASWLNVISEFNAANGGIHVFDTAHNFYVQLLVEMGLLFTLAHLALLALFAKEILLGQSSIGLSFACLFLVSLVVAGLVQEVDYIRPTFYLFAFGAGVALSLKRPEYLRSEKRRTSLQAVGGSDGLRFAEGVSSCKAHLVIGSTMILAAIYIIYLFNVGVYPYEFKRGQVVDGDLKMTRWLGVESKIASGSGFFADRLYAYHPVAENFIPLEYKYRQDVLGAHLPGFPLKSIAAKGAFIAANGSMFFPGQTFYRFKSGGDNGTRRITAKIGYPAAYSNSFLMPFKGPIEYHFFDGQVEMVCKGECYFLASSCGIGGEARLKIGFFGDSPLPDVKVTYAVGEVASSHDLDEIARSTRYYDSQMLVIGAPGVGRSVFIKGKETSHGLVPVRMSLPGKGGDIGVRIRSDCR